MEYVLSIIPFTSEIIGVDDKHVYLKETYSDDIDFKIEIGVPVNLSDLPDSHDCVLKVKRSEFMKLSKLWLNSKAGYCKRFNEFCGVFGNFYAERYKEIGTMELLDEVTEDEELIYKTVPVFEVIKFSTICDMEHG